MKQKNKAPQKRNLSKTRKKKLILGAAGFLLPYLVVMLLLLMLLLPGGGVGSSTGQIAIKGLDIPYELLIRAESEARRNSISFPLLLFYLTQETEGNDVQAMAAAVDKAKNSTLDREDREMYDLFIKAYGALKAGPIPTGIETVYKRRNDETGDYEETSTSYTSYTYTSYNDFGDARGYGDVTAHEGNDLMADMGVPLVSITEGKVVKNGWNEYGGYRVGIESEHGTYFYYAHMLSRGIVPEGSRVTAGQVIGYVGDSGQGPEGTTGQFPPHLHLQIGLKVEDNEDYLWINPYNIVKYLDTKRITLTEEVTED